MRIIQLVLTVLALFVISASLVTGIFARRAQERAYDAQRRLNDLTDQRLREIERRYAKGIV